MMIMFGVLCVPTKTLRIRWNLLSPRGDSHPKKTPKCGSNKKPHHPPNHHFSGRDSKHSQSWVVYGIVLPTLLVLLLPFKTTFFPYETTSKPLRPQFPTLQLAIPIRIFASSRIHNLSEVGN